MSVAEYKHEGLDEFETKPITLDILKEILCMLTDANVPISLDVDRYSSTCTSLSNGVMRLGKQFATLRSWNDDEVTQYACKGYHFEIHAHMDAVEWFLLTATCLATQLIMINAELDEILIVPELEQLEKTEFPYLLEFRSDIPMVPHAPKLSIYELDFSTYVYPRAVRQEILSKLAQYPLTKVFIEWMRPSEWAEDAAILPDVNCLEFGFYNIDRYFTFSRIGGEYAVMMHVGKPRLDDKLTFSDLPITKITLDYYASGKNRLETCAGVLSLLHAYGKTLQELVIKTNTIGSTENCEEMIAKLKDDNVLPALLVVKIDY